VGAEKEFLQKDMVEMALRPEFLMFLAKILTEFN
jgi:hypothetical protein